MCHRCGIRPRMEGFVHCRICQRVIRKHHGTCVICKQEDGKMTDFDTMIAMLRNIQTPEHGREVFVKTFYDSILEQQFTEICIGKHENGDWPDIIFSFDEDTGKLHHVYP